MLAPAAAPGARGRDGRLVLWTVMPLGSVANDRLRYMLIGWGGLARTSRDAPQEPHYK